MTTIVFYDRKLIHTECWGWVSIIVWIIVKFVKAVMFWRVFVVCCDHAENQKAVRKSFKDSPGPFLVEFACSLVSTHSLQTCKWGELDAKCRMQNWTDESCVTRNYLHCHECNKRHFKKVEHWNTILPDLTFLLSFNTLTFCQYLL